MVGTVIWRATNNPNGVEDLVQETFLRVFRGLAYFDDRAKLSTWIYTIAHRVAIDHLRKIGRFHETQLDPEADIGLGAPGMVTSARNDPEVTLSREEMRRFIQDGMAQLP